EEHVGRCSDCWAMLSLLHELATGEPAAGAERMGALFGCGPIRDEMYLLAGLTAEEIRRRHPHVARHLGWCHACRDRVAEVMAIERAATRGELGPPLVTPAAPRRRGLHGRAGGVPGLPHGRAGGGVPRTAADEEGGAEEGSAGARAEGGVPAAGLATVGRVEPRAARPRPRRDGAARLGT